MSETVPIVPESAKLGNTKQASPALKWCFTLNNYTEIEYKEMLDQFSSNSSKFSYIIGKEVGASGTPHLQGYVKFDKKQRPSALKLSKRIHWESCKGSEEDNIKYCSKDGNYVTNMKVKRPLKILDKCKLYDWQKDIISIVEKEPDDRVIHWYWEDKGNVGKTTFAKYLSHHYGAIPVEGKKNDILYCCAEFESDIYIFDFERSMEEYISYGAIEKIKNGYFMCAKYESKPIIRNPPHVIIFANFEPDKLELSLDRWHIVKIK